MRKSNRNKKAAVLCTCMVLAMGATGCSAQNVTPQVNPETNIGTEENIFPNTEPNNRMEDGIKDTNSPLDNTQDETSASLFENADLTGSVVDFSDTEFSVSPAVTQTDESGGRIMIEAAPGSENQEELVHVTYEDNVIVQILTMDSESLKQISLIDSDKSIIKKQTSVLIFGFCQDTYQWTANKVVVVRWQ